MVLVRPRRRAPATAAASSLLRPRVEVPPGHSLLRPCDAVPPRHLVLRPRDAVRSCGCAAAEWGKEAASGD